ncbi:MAG: PAS domain S-box protein [Blastocatellia bacterium]|nr:PAS domain S-box protein [Blastocatellia bacterium]
MRNKLIWLIASRLTVILILLGTATIINILSPVTSLVSVFIGATLFTGLLSIIYGFVIKLSTRYSLQAYIQLAFDILLVSWIVYRTSTTEKSFAALYLVVVLAASTVLTRAGVLSIALFCVLSYTLIIGMLYYGIPNTTTTYINPEQSAPLYILAMLVIGILGGQISERLRSSHVELAIATQHIANLQAFNERIIESIHSGLVTTDIDGKILSFNRAAEELTQYKSSQVVNKVFPEIFGDVSQYLKFGQEEFRDETRISRPTRFTIICNSALGKQMHLGMTASPLSSETGEIRGLVFSFQDLTEIIKLEQEIRKRDRLAAMGKMAAGIAHEIRNPLAAMRGSIQVLQSELELTEDQLYLMKIVLRESDRLDKIVSDFLAYARPSPAKLVEFDLVKLVKEAADLIKYSAEKKETHELEVISPTPPLLFRADPNQITQVIWNLSRNALQAMRDGGKLTITLKQTKDEVEFIFSDTGVGMSSAEMERMFEPFNSSRQGGTGLGLAIVYQIISDHNGKIEVESTPNVGTHIKIFFPSETISSEVSSEIGSLKSHHIV